MLVVISTKSIWAYLFWTGSTNSLGCNNITFKKNKIKLVIIELNLGKMYENPLC